MIRNLFVKLWKDESGVIATEYLMLSSIVAVGSAAGMAAMRDSLTDEYKDFGQNVHETRQAYLNPSVRTPSNAAGNRAYGNPISYGNPNGTMAPVQMPQNTPTFSMP